MKTVFVKIGDRVRVTIEGTLVSVDANCVVIRGDAGSDEVYADNIVRLKAAK